MGRIRTHGIKKLSAELIEERPNDFCDDFEKNKEVLNEMNLRLDKSVRNKVAGYITTTVVVNSKKRP